MAEEDAGDEEPSTPHPAVAWFVMILIGPLHFLGEMVGPLGGTSRRQWLSAILGTWLWVAAIWWVIQHV